MSHCLDKLIAATTPKAYDFWYYQSLLEVPYKNLLDYYRQSLWERPLDMRSVFEEEPEFKPKKSFRPNKGKSKYGK